MYKYICCLLNGGERDIYGCIQHVVCFVVRVIDFSNKQEGRTISSPNSVVDVASWEIVWDDQILEKETILQLLQQE